MNPEVQFATMQAEIASLQQQLVQTNEALSSANNTINSMQQVQQQNQVVVPQNNLKCGKPDKFDGTEPRSWLVSLENIFDAAIQNIDDVQKIKYAVSFMTGNALQWWEMIKLNETMFESYESFKEKLLEYFEPVNREEHARKILSSLKQMGKFNSISAYNQEFSKYLLQVPDMAINEQLFHYIEGLKYRVKVEVKRIEPTNLQSAMRIADRMDRIYAPQTNNFNRQNTYGQRPTPMEIGNIRVRLSEQEKRRRIQHKLCFVCGKPNCFARNHRNNNRNNRMNQNYRNDYSSKN